jgi:hypothetical protein
MMKKIDNGERWPGHACNPSHSVGGGRRISVQDQPRQKFESLLEKKNPKTTTTKTKKPKNWEYIPSGRALA